MKRSLQEIFDSNQLKQSIKWRAYLHLYESLWHKIRDDKVKILEIGIKNGGFLHVLLDYFHNLLILVGCDIDYKCKQLHFSDDRVITIIGDINNPLTQKQIANHSELFDIIIDDGSHMSGDIIRTFTTLFKKLEVGGMYIIEDIHCSYMPHYQGHFFGDHSSMEFLKTLAELPTSKLFGKDIMRSQLKCFSNKYNLDYELDSLLEIKSVYFENSVCVITKDSLEQCNLGPFIVSGKEHLKGKDDSNLDGKQFTNIFQEIINIARTSFNPNESYTNILERSDELLRQLEQEQTYSGELRLLLDNTKSSLSWRITKPLRSAKQLFCRITKS